MKKVSSDVDEVWIDFGLLIVDLYIALSFKYTKLIIV